MIRALYRNSAGELKGDLMPTEFSAAVNDAGGMLWVDFEAASPQEAEPILREVFGFHPLAIDDALQESHVPKVDDWEDYLYLVLHAIQYDRSGDGRVETRELDVFLGRNYLVTHHDEPISSVNRVWDACRRDARFVSRGADHLLYRIVDDLVAAYMPIVEEIDETIEELEDQIFDRPSNAHLAELFALKRALLHLRRIIGPQREVLNRLARDDYEVVDAKDRVFFRDVYDHLVRLHDINESMRDLVGGALDTYLSVVNNRMNDVMKTLTVITTLFMPLTFVVGFFGMNYFAPVDSTLSAWTNPASYVITLLLMSVTPLAMLVWMHRRRWL
jgi:magnesium transporter